MIEPVRHRCVPEHLFVGYGSVERYPSPLLGDTQILAKRAKTIPAIAVRKPHRRECRIDIVIRGVSERVP